MLRLSWKLLASLLLLILTVGCAPELGDACKNHRDCAGVEARSCDTSSPGGYCTIFDCERNDCPDESVCVNFGEVTACMKRCDKRSCDRQDEGYVCRHDIGPVPFCYISDRPE